MADPRLCSIPECGKSVRHRGWCNMHHKRFLKYGDPLAGATPKGEVQRFYREVALTYEGDECLIWPFSCTRGYGVMSTLDGLSRFVSRRLCEEVNGPPPTPKHHAAHSCGNGHLGCVTKRHLSWKTPSANRMDCVEHGTHNHGERNGQSKLTATDVQKIRASTGRCVDLAAEYGVAVSYVYKIRSRERWAWLD